MQSTFIEFQSTFCVLKLAQGQMYWVHHIPEQESGRSGNEEGKEKHFLQLISEGFLPTIVLYYSAVILELLLYLMYRQPF